MRVAIPTWENRISPVFDTAKQLLVVDIENHRETARQIHPLASGSLMRRIETLSQLGIDLLICGAITRPLLGGLTRTGIQIIPYVCGNVESILKSVIAGEGIETRFAMPGRGRRRHRHGRRGMNNNSMPYSF